MSFILTISLAHALTLQEAVERAAEVAIATSSRSRRRSSIPAGLWGVR